MSYFDRIKLSDIHIVLDHVTLSKGDFVNRTRIRQRDGRPMWLTIPVEKGKPINETRVMDQKWKWKHRMSLAQAYPDCHIHIPGGELLAPILYVTTAALFHALKVDHRTVLSSTLGGSKLGQKSTLILNLCKEVGADTYLSGPNGKDYLDLPAFEKAGIAVQWHDYPVVQPVLSAVHDLFWKESVAV